MSTIPKRYTELELKLMNVDQLKQLLRQNYLSLPKLKADMVKSLLKNKIGTDGLLHPEIQTEVEAVSQSIQPFQIEQLPPEMILNVCQQMDIRTLQKMMQSSSKIKAICQSEINKRLQEETSGEDVALHFDVSALGYPAGGLKPKHIKRLIGQCIVNIRKMTKEEKKKTGMGHNELVDIVIELSDGSIIYWNIQSSGARNILFS